MPSRVLYTSVAGFLCGVALNTVLFHIVSGYAAMFLACCCAVCTYVYRAHPRVFLMGVCLCSVCVGVARHAYTLSYRAHDALVHAVGEVVDIVGVVSEEPDRRETHVRLMVTPHLYNNTTLEGYRHDILVVAPYTDTEFLYGDEVRLSGLLQLPENFETDTGRVFDYRAYLEKDNVGYYVDNPTFSLLSRGHGSFLRRALLYAKQAFIARIEYAIPSPESALAGGILLGTKQSLGKDLQEKFRQVGLVHIVVLSGYNVTIVAECIIKMFSFLPKPSGVLGGVFGIIVFAIVTGSGATVVRASIMACIALVARAYGREYDLLRALAIAATVMVLHNPLILISDPSFQLSCMATFALVACVPFFESRLSIIPEKFGLRACVATTLATQCFLFPMLVYMTGMVSFISLVTNVLVPPLIPSAMGLSFLAGVVGFLLPICSTMIGLGAYMLLRYALVVVEFGASVPYAYTTVPRISAWLVVVFYVVFMIEFVRRRSFVQQRTS